MPCCDHACALLPSTAPVRLLHLLLLLVPVYTSPLLHCSLAAAAASSRSSGRSVAGIEQTPSLSLPYPVPTVTPSLVYVIDYEGRSLDDQLLLTTLQGSLAQRALQGRAVHVPLVYRLMSNGTGQSDEDSDYAYLRYYSQHYPEVNFTRSLAIASLTAILSTLRPHVAGALLATFTGDSSRIAISLAGITADAIVVSDRHVELMQQLSIPILSDLRAALNESAFLLSFAPFNQSASAKPWPFHTRFFSSQVVYLAPSYLSDWTVMNGVVMVNHVDSVQLILDHIQQPQSVLCAWLGWTPDGEWEDWWLHAVSKAGGMVWAADTLSNLATHAFFRREELHNPTRMDRSRLPDNANRHTVSFMWTDGDSLCADQHGLADGGRWQSALRDAVPMTFGLDSSLAHLAPGLLGWYYDTATPNSSLAAFAPAYTYPDELPEAQRWQWGELAGEAMALADVGVTSVIGFNYSEVYLEPLLAQWNVEGAVWLQYLSYYVEVGRNGSVLWIHDKPLIAIRESLWVDHSTQQSIADLINAQSREHTSERGYSVIAVMAWSNSAADVVRLSEMLDEDVVVVKLDEMVQLMKQNIPAASRSRPESRPPVMLA